MFVRISLVMAMVGYVLAFDDDCPLSGQSLYGWQVRIYDKVRSTTVAHGSIISYLAVVSGCSTFDLDHFPHSEHNRYDVIGQKLKDMRKFARLDQWCTQTRTVKQIIPHPKCIEQNNPKYTHINLRRAFDFSIFLLNEPFETRGAYTYPTFTLPVTARRLLVEITTLNVEPYAICEMPVFKQRGSRLPTAQTEALVKSIPFHSQCLEKYCDLPDTGDHYLCLEFFSVRANGTQLCQYPTWTQIFSVPADQLNWYVGTPYSCNGTSYGQAGDLKRNQLVNKDGKDVRQDFFYVPTYLRVWPWLQGAIARFGASAWIKPFYVEAQNIVPEVFEPAPRAPILDQILPQRNPRRKPEVPADFQSIWYRSAGSSSYLSGFVFVSVLIAQI